MASARDDGQTTIAVHGSRKNGKPSAAYPTLKGGLAVAAMPDDGAIRINLPVYQTGRIAANGERIRTTIG